MLAIGRAIIGKPRLILLDEPSRGLAPLVVESIFELVRRLNARDGVTVLVVEQNASIALEISHRAYVLEVGRVAFSGESAALARDEGIRSAYLGY
jgi:branched-chain amino acid transport system ATP-binding protein